MNLITLGRPVPIYLFALVVFVILALTIYLYLKAKGINTGMRFRLSLMRIAALGLIVFALLEPSTSETKTITRKKHLPVLLDISKSMSLKDQRKQPEDIVEAATALGLVESNTAQDVNQTALQLDNKQRTLISSASRLDLAAKLITKSAKPVFDELAQGVDINYYTFGNTVNMIGSSDKDTMESLSSLKATETGTSIADSLEAVANARGGAPLAGIVLISDGIDTSSRRTEAIVNDLGTRGIPVYTIPVGISDPDDVSIRSLIMQDVAFTGDTVPVRVQVRSKGYERRDVDIVLKYNGEELSRKTIVLKGGVQYEELSFDVKSHKKGAAEIELVLEPFTDESTADNNRIKRSLRVVNEKINVLCIEGFARWEYRYLRAILKRDPRINATFIAAKSKTALAQLSSDYIGRFPDDAEQAFKYDLVILGDVDAAFFTDAEMARLEELIRERGGSLLVLCGRRNTPSSYAGTVIENMLPVRFDPDSEWRDVEDTVHPVLTADGRSSLVMTLEDTREKNDFVWSRVSPMYSVPPFLSIKQGATVLATLSNSEGDDYPLISWQRYGTGKCMVMGTDNLWRLRYKTADKYHWRVWSQSIQFLTLSRLMGEHKRIRIETDRVSYPVGAQVRVYASVFDESYDPVTQASYDVYVKPIDDDSNDQALRVTLRPNPSNPGQYEGYFSPDKVTRYSLKPPSEDESYANSIEFQVAEINTEVAHPESQLDRLDNIAALSGGERLSMTQINELLSLVDKDPEIVTVEGSRSIWDHWLVMLSIIGLVGVEWMMRRKRNLA